MKQNIPIALFAVSALFLSFCKHHRSEIFTTQAGNEAVLSWQECVEFSDYDMTICFVEASEYRCPCDAQCIWEGAVYYTLRAQGAGLDSTFTLTTSDRELFFPRTITLNNIKVDIAEEPVIACADYGDYELYKVKVNLLEE